MTKAKLLRTILLFQVAIVCVLPQIARAAAKIQTAAAALTGQVSSKEEGPMEGVLVSARKEGSTFTISVVSNAQGRYSFPRARLEPGSYLLGIRAAGYSLNDSGPVEITANKSSQFDVKLHKAQDLAAQLSNQEWLMSMPGTEDQKKNLLYCASCHTLERIMRTDYKTPDLAKVVARMHTYYTGSTPLQPQVSRGFTFPPGVAEYLSTVNLSSVRKWEYPLKTVARPKGKATEVIVTEYDLPRAHAMPHDVVPDSAGMVWYNDFGRQFMGRLDPKTGVVVEYPVPLLKPGVPTGSHDLGLDQEGNPWLGMSNQGAVAKFDRKTEKIQTWSVPRDPGSDVDPGSIGVRPQFLHLDGKVWVLGGSRIQRLDARSGEWLRESVDVFRDFPKDSPVAKGPHAIYDIVTDSKNNCWFTDFRADYIGKVDAKTLKVSFYPVPTSNNSFPRRSHFDKQDRMWFAEYLGNKMAMFDPETERFKEWPMPNAFSWPYDVALDKNGDAWTAGMISDHATRLDTKTGEFVEYLLPRFANIRHVEVDNSTNPPSLWVGSNHQGTILRVEPLE